MTVIGLGTKKRGFRLPILPLISGGLLLVALILLALELVRFAQGRETLQTDITVAGVSVTGLRLSEAVAEWETVYQQPIELNYLGHPILLLPSDIGFQINSQQMQEEIRARSQAGGNYWTDFWNYLWRRPTTPIEIALTADYSEARLRAFLEDVGTRYDQSASSGQFDMNTMLFGSGASGRKIDIPKAVTLVDEALQSPTHRRVTLPMQNEGARTADMNMLQQAILTYLAQPDPIDNRAFNPNGPETLASVGVIDLQTGQEMWINPDIAYSALSTIKIPIIINLFSNLVLAPDNDTKWLMAASILCSNNSASNFLIQIPGSGTSTRSQMADGLAKVDATVTALGARYTFINAPLYVGVDGDAFSINNSPPAVPNPNFDAKPDTWSRTTPEDMALLLQGLYDCSEYNSGFIAAMPNAFDQRKCKQMVELMSGNIINRLIELGVPLGTRVAHKNGWGGTARTGANVSDAAIVYTPGGNYILVMYMWEAQANQDGIGSLVPWRKIEGVSRIVFNYFNPNDPLLVSRVAENPFGAIDCVMPDPNHSERIDLDNISNGRFDAQGHLEPDACYGYPACGKDTPPDIFKSK